MQSRSKRQDRWLKTDQTIRQEDHETIYLDHDSLARKKSQKFIQNE